MNLIAFSDLHIAHPMIDDEILENLVKDIKLNIKADSIICFTGDLMHKKVELNDIASQRAVKLLNELDELNVPIILIEGTFSHDYRYMDTLVEVGFKNVTFIRKTSELKLKNNLNEEINVLCIPEEYVEDQVEYYKNTVYNKKKVYDLVLMHGTFTDVLFHNINIESQDLRKSPKFDSNDFSRHTLTLSGHIHRHQILGKKKNIIYVGSYSNMNFGSDVSAHLLSIDLDKENKSFSMRIVDNKATHTFQDLTIDETNYHDFESVILPMINNKSDRHHLRVYMKHYDKLITDTLKQLKKDHKIKSLVCDKFDEKLNNISESSQDKVEAIDYASQYHGPLPEQIKTYISNVYDKEMDISLIESYLK